MAYQNLKSDFLKTLLKPIFHSGAYQ